MVIKQVTPVKDIHEKKFDKVQDIPSSNTFKQETLREAGQANRQDPGQLNLRSGKKKRFKTQKITAKGEEIS